MLGNTIEMGSSREITIFGNAVRKESECGWRSRPSRSASCEKLPSSHSPSVLVDENVIIHGTGPDFYRGYHRKLTEIIFGFLERASSMTEVLSHMS
jgi:hypothetical protein